ncbi:hypothetical protein BZA77DRAFT_118797 [Pyronema omphalodes]|nr:hypothetical protein BZA77DRAFT_118797 [Pyronema omphalodes]
MIFVTTIYSALCLCEILCFSFGLMTVLRTIVHSWSFFLLGVVGTGDLHKPRLFEAIKIRVCGLPPGLKDYKGVLILKRASVIGKRVYEGIRKDYPMTEMG